MDFPSVLHFRKTFSLKNLSYSHIRKNKSMQYFLPKFFIRMVSDFKQNNSTFKKFALLVLMDYIRLLPYRLR